MKNVVVDLDGEKLCTWAMFHKTFKETLGFPEHYRGRSLDAWIDCMTSLDDPEDGLTKVHARKGHIVVLDIKNSGAVKANAPEIWSALNECVAFVNFRRIETGDEPVLALSYWR